jgi:serine/threonine protein kinase
MSVHADYRRVMDVFDVVCDLPAHAQAEAIEHLCAGDDSLRHAVERMLRHDRVSDGEIIEIEIGAGVQILAADMATDERPKPSTLEPGAVPALIGQYRIIRKIGEGGMGVVYLAQQHKPQRTVALKVIRGAPRASSASLRRFEHEAHILGLLAHPGIAQIFEAGTAEPIMADGSKGGTSQPFFAMEFIDGTPITTCAADHSPSAVGHRGIHD